MKTLEIYVVVHVSYNSYRFRFQTNLAATTDFADARKIAEKEAKRFDLPVVEEIRRSYGIGLSETSHIWIEIFECWD